MLGNIFIFCLYFIMALIFIARELRYLSKNGVDGSTFVSFFIFLYTILPSTIIYLIISFNGGQIQTGVFFFDKVISNLSFQQSITLFLLLSLFIIGFMLFRYQEKSVDHHFQRYDFVKLKGGFAFFSSALLFIICSKFFWDLGASFSERYAGLVMFRALDENSERNFFTANAFALTQTLTWFASAMLYISWKKNKTLLFFVYAVFTVTGVLLMGSRRAVIFAFIIVYFSSIMGKKSVKMHKVAWVVPLFVLWIAFGKEFAWSNAYGTQSNLALVQYSSSASLLMRSFCDIGITQIASLAVLQNFDISFRLGVDHILSVLRRLPDGMLGFDINWPERIVRIATGTFTSSDDADIAPGLIGQSWLDFPIMGAFIWGAFIGFQSRLLCRWAGQFRESPERNALVALIALIIALPINTGSFDFTFSVDIIVLVAVILLTFRLNKVREN